MQFARVRKLARQKKIGRLFKPEALVCKDAAHKFVDIVAAVIQFPFHRDAFAVHFVHRLDLGDLCKPRQDALSVQIAKSLLDVVLFIKFRIDPTGVRALTRKIADLDPFIFGEKPVFMVFDSHLFASFTALSDVRLFSA